ncbi:MAG TPA: type II toxin-antitoxin system Phd/YefM family antitoxin [Bryobacteraceae bacterium]|nr:type II toxin-antitoxin system Phd/YefM family antitoxin [Bryobacteraceae bacterium]
MKTVNIHAAKTHLSSLVEEAAAGEEIVIAKAGKPVARLVPLEKKRDLRKSLGIMKGKIWMSDDFDAPLPPEILRGFGTDE